MLHFDKVADKCPNRKKQDTEESIREKLFDGLELNTEIQLEFDAAGTLELDEETKEEIKSRIVVRFHNNARLFSTGDGGNNWPNLPQNAVNREFPLSETVKLDMIHVKAGSFWMGSPTTEEGARRHYVKLTKDFWIGKFPVTQEQWEAVMGTSPSFHHGDKLPVENVSYDDALEFCTRINMRLSVKPPAGYTFALPTEAQWEYACRAGTETAFSFGDPCNGNECNCNGTNPYGTDEKGPSLGKTSEVGKYGPNPWGICDMHGNVWEWCSDLKGEYESGTPKAPVVDPTGPAEGSYRVVRGGSWFNNARLCRSSFRDWNQPDDRGHDLGFRLVLSSSSQ